MKFFVYVIVSETKGLRFYVGLTKDPDQRLNDHNLGRTRSTKAYRPWNFFFIEECTDRISARKREIYLKSGIGKELIKNKWSHSSTG